MGGVAGIKASALTRRQWEILEILEGREGYMTRGDIAKELYGTWNSPDFATESIGVQISRIRRIVGRNAIETRPSRSGGGYRLVNTPDARYLIEHDRSTGRPA